MDAAPTYENEKAVGECLADRYLIVKVPNKAADSDSVRSSVSSSLHKLGRPSCDLLLLHWPAESMTKGTLREVFTVAFAPSLLHLLPCIRGVHGGSQVWATMEALKLEGVCRSIGVCNFTPAALTELMSGCKVPPVVNQANRAIRNFASLASR